MNQGLQNAKMTTDNKKSSIKLKFLYDSEKNWRPVGDSNYLSSGWNPDVLGR